MTVQPNNSEYSELARLKKLMADTRYWRDQNPAIVRQVRDGFAALYDGNARTKWAGPKAEGELALAPTPAVSDTVRAANRREVDALLKSGDDGMFPTLHADHLGSGGEVAAYHDFIAQVAERAPSRAQHLHQTVCRHLADRGAAPEVLHRAASVVQSQGRNGDSVLAHISPAEAKHLGAHGGSGTRNPRTGLLEFWGTGPSPGRRKAETGSSVGRLRRKRSGHGMSPGERKARTGSEVGVSYPDPKPSPTTNGQANGTGTGTTTNDATQIAAENKRKAEEAARKAAAEKARVAAEKARQAKADAARRAAVEKARQAKAAADRKAAEQREQHRLRLQTIKAAQDRKWAADKKSADDTTRRRRASASARGNVDDPTGKPVNNAFQRLSSQLRGGTYDAFGDRIKPKPKQKEASRQPVQTYTPFGDVVEKRKRLSDSAVSRLGGDLRKALLANDFKKVARIKLALGAYSSSDQQRIATAATTKPEPKANPKVNLGEVILNGMNLQETTLEKPEIIQPKEVQLTPEERKKAEDILANKKEVLVQRGMHQFSPEVDRLVHEIGEAGDKAETKDMSPGTEADLRARITKEFGGDPKGMETFQRYVSWVNDGRFSRDDMDNLRYVGSDMARQQRFTVAKGFSGAQGFPTKGR